MLLQAKCTKPRRAPERDPSTPANLSAAAGDWPAKEKPLGRSWGTSRIKKRRSGGGGPKLPAHCRALDPRRRHGPCPPRGDSGGPGPSCEWGSLPGGGAVRKRARRWQTPLALSVLNLRFLGSPCQPLATDLPVKGQIFHREAENRLFRRPREAKKLNFK